MNKHGWLAVEVAWFVVAIALTTFSLHPRTRSDFQRKKAEALCQQNYKSVSCSAVSDMTSEEVLAYIKDDVVIPQYQMLERLGG